MIVKKISDDKRREISEMLKAVFDALDEKGYDAVGQILGYIFTEDPTYITTYNNARKMIGGFDREDIARYLLEMHFNI